MPIGQANLFGLHQYDFKTSFFGGTAPLSQAWGYVVVIGFGVFFSVVTTAMVYIDYWYGGTKHTSEQFNTAGRTIKTGLIAVDIVSHWTWAATLLQSSNVAFKFGVSGPFWYAAGATIQILLFGILAIEIKRKAPNAHTILEIVKARWGTAAHLTFFFFCILTNIIVTGMLLLGGSSVVNALTGINIYAAAFLIPLGIILYTAAGGLKATFMSSYIHTVIIYVALCLFIFYVYASSDPVIGSPSKVYDNLAALARRDPVPNNKGGAYLTMFSRGGLIFGIINIVGNFGTVFVDQAYWQSAIAARPSASARGYLLGGLMWFCIPFSLATSLGLAVRALDLPVTFTEAGQGLVPPAAALYLMGKGGAILIVTMLFMAVTSSGSAELIAVSSLFTYDLYRPYFRPNATGQEIMRFSQYIVVLFGLFMGVLAVALQQAGVSLGWLYEAMGNFIGSAVIPIAMCLTWKKCTAIGAMAGAIIGQLAAVVTWLVYTQVGYKSISLDTTGRDYPMLVGNLVAILSSGLICTVISLIKPDDYDWSTSREIKMIEADTTGIEETGPDSPAAMEKTRKWIWTYGSIISIVLIVVWPLLALPAGVFSKGYFTFWIIISIVWGLIASCIAIVMPLWESREHLVKMIYHAVTCQRVEAGTGTNKDIIGEPFEKVSHPELNNNPYLVEEEERKAAAKAAALNAAKV